MRATELLFHLPQKLVASGKLMPGPTSWTRRHSRHHASLPAGQYLTHFSISGDQTVSWMEHLFVRTEDGNAVKRLWQRGYTVTRLTALAATRRIDEVDESQHQIPVFAVATPPVSTEDHQISGVLGRLRSLGNFLGGHVVRADGRLLPEGRPWSCISVP